VQELLSRAIATAFLIGRMSGAVDLDDKFFLAANEVDETGTNRLLPNELESAEQAASKSSPKLAFSVSLALAQTARSARFVQS
jgi:hypothetical protein